MKNKEMGRSPNPEPEEEITTADLDRTNQEGHQAEPDPSDPLIRRRYVIIPRPGGVPQRRISEAS